MKRKRAKQKNAALIQKNKSLRVLVILHLFYPHSWIEIREYLRNLEDYSWDLVVTIPKNVFNEDVEHQILFDYPHARIFTFENMGYDIGPFVELLSQIDTSEYDVVFKLQSKGVKRRFIYIYGQAFICRDWMVNLFEGVMGADVIHKTIDAVAHNQAGMACARNLLVRDPLHKRHLVQNVLKSHELTALDDYQFVAGTCFAMHPSLIPAILSTGFKLEDFTPTPSSRGMSLAHVVERYMCMLVPLSGLSFYTSNVCRLRRIWKRPLEMYLHRHSSERLFELPYSYDDEFFYWQLDNHLIKYKARKVRIGDLCYQDGAHAKKIPLDQTAPYRYLCGDESAYDRYCEQHAAKGLPLMNKDRFDALKQSIEENGFDARRIILVSPYNVIVDGQHRACCLAYLEGLDREIDVLEIRGYGRQGWQSYLIPVPLVRVYRKFAQSKFSKRSWRNQSQETSIGEII